MYKIPFKLTSIRTLSILHNEVFDSFPPIQDGHESHVVQQDSEFGEFSPPPVQNKENPKLTKHSTDITLQFSTMCSS
jgi:hypothetical protein